MENPTMENTNAQNPTPQNTTAQNPATQSMPTKFCQHCGGQIPANAVICTLCGCQVSSMNQAPAAQPNIVINNANSNVNTNTNMMGMMGRAKNKWVALILCIFLGMFGAHKFYEGKAGMGILYLFTMGLFGIGVVIDFLVLLFKPNPYYV